jgi:hypothetical protein
MATLFKTPNITRNVPQKLCHSLGLQIQNLILSSCGIKIVSISARHQTSADPIPIAPSHRQAHLPSTLESDAELAAALAGTAGTADGEAFQVRRIEFLGQEAGFGTAVEPEEVWRGYPLVMSK